MNDFDRNVLKLREREREEEHWMTSRVLEVHKKSTH